MSEAEDQRVVLLEQVVVEMLGAAQMPRVVHREKDEEQNLQIADYRIEYLREKGEWDHNASPHWTEADTDRDRPHDCDYVVAAND